MDTFLGNGKTSSRVGKFLHKIQTAAQHDDLPLKLKKPVTKYHAVAVKLLLEAEQASVNSTNVWIHS